MPNGTSEPNVEYAPAPEKRHLGIFILLAVLAIIVIGGVVWFFFLRGRGVPQPAPQPVTLEPARQPTTEEKASLGLPQGALLQTVHSDRGTTDTIVLPDPYAPTQRNQAPRQ
jgi:hypothetical protein